ncbi:protein yls3 [Quercus suber]|uniref:Protein yls3 n=1 Tax=Quercus suber TaxID=58331 RepID=A0AAW0JMC6_QUESU
MAIALHPSTLILPFLLVLMSVIVSYTMADAAKDREECAQQLVGLATCLPYVGEAQVFYQLGRSSNQSDVSPAPSPSENYLNLWVISLAICGGSSTSAKSEGTSGQDKNESC